MANRIARSPGGLKTFDLTGKLPGPVPAAPFNDGETAAAAARVFAGLAGTLGKIATAAQQREGEAAGLAAAQAAYEQEPGGTVTDPVKQRKFYSGPRSAKQNQGPIGGDNLGTLIRQSANELGISAHDLATVISYETGGRFSTSIKHPNGINTGLIQFGAAEQRKYGVRAGQSYAEQMRAVTRFLKDRGVQPGMGLLDLYSTVNAGSPGRYEAKDGNTTVRQKVELMRREHGGNARRVLGDASPPKPLALRTDETVGAEAYNAAIAKGAAWREATQLDTEISAAADRAGDDINAFSAELKRIREERAPAFGDDPRMREIFEQTFVKTSTPYAKDVMARAQTKAANDLEAATLTNLGVRQDELERKSYRLGASSGSDEELDAAAQDVLGAVDEALRDGALTPLAAAKKRQEVVTGMVTARVRGVFDALPTPDAKAKFAAGLREAWSKGEGPLERLGKQEVDALTKSLEVDARHAARALKADTSFQKWQLKQQLADDVKSMEQTGTGVMAGDKPIDPAQVAEVLGPDDAAKWFGDRQRAKAFHAVTQAFPTMTSEDITEELERVKPKPGSEGYAEAAALHERMEKHAEAVLKLRREDPAKAVEAFPQVQAAIAAAEEEGGPENLARARLAAQAAIGVPELGRNVLTSDEAMSLAQPILLNEPDEPAMHQSVQALIAKSREQYGELADDVVSQVLRSKGIDRDTAKAGAVFMRKMMFGQTLVPIEVEMLRAAGETDLANRALAGEQVIVSLRSGGSQGDRKANPKGQPGLQFTRQQQGPNALTARREPVKQVPNARQIERLKAHPELAPAFDEKFGDGAAKAYLEVAPAQEPGRSVQMPDGSVRRVEDDGSVTTIAPDGTESWTP